MFTTAWLQKKSDIIIAKDRHVGLATSHQVAPYPEQPKLMDRAVFPPTSLLPALGRDPILAGGFSPGGRF